MTLLVPQNVYAAYLDGDATPYEALRSLCMDLGEVESELKPLEQQRDVLRERISGLVDKLGGKAEVAGFGKLQITSPSITTGFDKAQLTALIDELIADYPDIAQRLVACKTKSARAGGLRIEREKTK